MTSPSRHPIRKPKNSHLIGGAIAILALVTALLLWGQPLFAILTNRELAQSTVESAGMFGPLVFILLQVAQVVIAPIPGQVAGLLGGYLFGAYLGVLYSLIGATIGFTIIFFLARKFGRPFVERFFSKELIDKFDYITKTKGTFVLFIIFLLPAFPDDLICYLAGLTKIPIRTLILISLAGRLPGYLLLSFTGEGLAADNKNPIIALAIAAAIVFSLAYWQRSWLGEFAKSDDHMLFIKRRWKVSRRNTLLWIAGGILVLIALYLLATTMPPVHL
jgi:uncharacterized membrane protein YdjX (TVP38/TMEM64 family)